MSAIVVGELAGIPGVIAAGEYSYRGDRFSFKGQLTDEMARMASIMCRATTMSVHMQAGIMESFCRECGASPPRGWVVRGPTFTVCNVANVFCFMDSVNGSLNKVLSLMQDKLADADTSLV